MLQQSFQGGGWPSTTGATTHCIGALACYSCGCDVVALTSHQTMVTPKILVAQGRDGQPRAGGGGGGSAIRHGRRARGGAPPEARRHGQADQHGARVQARVQAGASPASTPEPAARPAQLADVPVPSMHFSRSRCMEAKQRPCIMAVLLHCRPVEFMASLYTGGTVPCIAFVSPDHRLIEDGLPPSERYLDLLRTGWCWRCVAVMRLEPACASCWCYRHGRKGQQASSRVSHLHLMC